MAVSTYDAALIAQKIYESIGTQVRYEFAGGDLFLSRAEYISSDGRFGAILDLAPSDPGTDLSGYFPDTDIWFGVAVTGFSLYYSSTGALTANPSSANLAYSAEDPEYESEIFYQSPSSGERKENMDSTFLPHFSSLLMADYKKLTIPLSVQPPNPEVLEGYSLEVKAVTSSILTNDRIYWTAQGLGVNPFDFNRIEVNRIAGGVFDGLADPPLFKGSTTVGENGNISISLITIADGDAEGRERITFRFFDDFQLKKQIGSDVNVDIVDELSGNAAKAGPQVVLSAEGLGRMVGGIGPTLFKFVTPDGFDSGSADIVTNFNPEEDKLLFSREFLPGVKNTSFKAVSSAKKFKKALKSKSTFVYKQLSGELFFNANGTKSGFGVGGLVAILEGAPPLSESRFDLI